MPSKITRDGPTDGRTDGRTDGGTDTTSYRDATAHLKTGRDGRAVSEICKKTKGQKSAKDAHLMRAVGGYLGESMPKREIESLSKVPE